jgi:imidazoleglycerol-phosphate dehydratase
LTDLDISPIVRSQYVRLDVDLVTFDITGGDGVPRTANITRKTKETKINMKLALDGSGECRIKTSVGFLDHMLTLLTAHGRFDLELQAEGDLWVDQHHTVEDIGICLGQAFAKAGEFETQLIQEFFRAFTVHAGVTMHINVSYGDNSHHIIEAIFKSWARALRYACEIEPGLDTVPSTKGVL